MSTEAVTAALDYARRGWPVFPCKPDKRPLLEGWPDKATCDGTVIREWWQRWPDALIGIVTGKPSGLLVLDIDCHAGGPDGAASLAALEREHGPMPAGPLAITPSGGRHLYMKMPEGVDIRNSAGKLAAGLDIRANGGYICAPGAGGYRWA